MATALADPNLLVYFLRGYFDKEVYQMANKGKRGLRQKLNLVAERVKNNSLALTCLRRNFIQNIGCVLELEQGNLSKFNK